MDRWSATTRVLLSRVRFAFPFRRHVPEKPHLGIAGSLHGSRSRKRGQRGCYPQPRDDVRLFAVYSIHPTYVRAAMELM